MKKYILTLSLILMSPFAQAGTPSDDLVVALKQFDTLSATFKQSVTADKSTEQSATGKMALKRPGKFHWETKTPTQQLLIADGQYVWLYDVDLEQVTRQSQQTSDHNSPAVFLTGDLTKINERFTVTEPAANTFLLKSKSPDDMFQSVKLTFDHQKLSSMAVDTKLGQRSEFHFTDVKYNPDLPKTTFNFTPPKGVDVIYND